ncbi:hypothetical protein Tco_0102848 [Tanacetum coccineum]
MVKLLRRFSEVTSSAAQLLINMLIEEYPLDETDTPKLQSKHPLNSLQRAMLHWSVLFAQCICLTSSANETVVQKAAQSLESSGSRDERSRQLDVKFNPSDARV